MPQQKYIVIKVEDVRRYISPDLQQSLYTILNTITNSRRQENRRVGHPFFVLSMTDKFAQAAIEAYINAIVADPGAQNDQGVQEALRIAREIRTQALMSIEPTNPT